MANGTLLNVPITFNGVSVGKEKVSVGIGIDHSRVTREQMGEMFVNRTLDIDLCTGEPDAQPLPGMDGDDVKIEATVTASSYSEKKSSFGTRLAMPKGDANPEDFWDLAGRSGWLRVRGSREADSNVPGPLPGQRELPHPDVEIGKDRPRSGATLEATAELRNHPIPRGRGGFTKPQAEIIESADITTMGQLVDLAVKGPQAMSSVLQCGDPIAEEIVRRVYAMGGDSPPPFVDGDDEPDRASTTASPVVSSSVPAKSAVPDMDKAEEFVVPMEGTKHWACITAAPLGGGGWSAGWQWEDDTDEASGGCVDADMPSAIVRKSMEQAVAAAAGQLVDSIQRSERPKSKAGTARREKAVAACQTFYAEAERGGKTIFEAIAS